MELNIEEIGKKVEMAFVAATKADRDGNEASQMFQLGLALGMLEMVESVFGVEQRDHMEKLAKSKVQEAKVRGYLYK